MKLIYILYIALIMIALVTADNIVINDASQKITVGNNDAVVNNTPGTYNITVNACVDANNATGYTYLQATMTTAQMNSKILNAGQNNNIMFLPGTYGLTDSIWLVGQRNYYIMPGAVLSWATGATPYQRASAAGGFNASFILLGTHTTDVNIYNYGKIFPHRTYRPSLTGYNGSYGIGLFNINRTYIHAGLIEADVPITVASNNTQWNEYIIIENLLAPNTANTAPSGAANRAAVELECIDKTIVKNIIGSGSTAVSLSHGVQRTMVTNVIFEKTNSDLSEFIDVNKAVTVRLTNLIGINYTNFANISTTSNRKWGNCVGASSANVYVEGTCDGCESASQMNVAEAMLIVNNGKNVIYTNGTLNMRTNNIINVKCITFVSGNTTCA